LGDFLTHPVLAVAKVFKGGEDFAPPSVNGFKDRNVQVIAPILEHLFDRIEIGSDEPKIQHEKSSREDYKDTFLSQMQLKRQTFLLISSILPF